MNVSEETFKCVKCGMYAPFGYTWPVTGQNFEVCLKHKPAADAAFDNAVEAANKSNSELMKEQQ